MLMKQCIKIILVLALPLLLLSCVSNPVSVNPRSTENFHARVTTGPIEENSPTLSPGQILTDTLEDTATIEPSPITYPSPTATFEPSPTKPSKPENCLDNEDIIQAAAGVLGILPDASMEEAQAAADSFAALWVEMEIHYKQRSNIRQFGENSGTMFAIDERGIFADSNYTNGIPLIGHYQAQRKGYQFTCGIFLNPAFDKTKDVYYGQIIPGVLDVTAPDGRWSSIHTNVGLNNFVWQTHQEFLQYLNNHLGDNVLVNFWLMVHLQSFRKSLQYGVMSVDDFPVEELMIEQFSALQTVEQINTFFGDTYSQYHIDEHGNMRYQLTAFRFAEILRAKGDASLIGPLARVIGAPVDD
jgi:hypothetical protein